MPRVFWYLWGGTLLNRLGDFVQPFLALYLSAARSLSAPQVGTVLSLWGAGAFMAGPLGGWLTDRFGRRPALITGTLAGALAMVHMGAARAVWHIALAAFLLGTVGQLYRPALQAATADLVDPAHRPRAFALLYWAANLGFAFSAVMAGLLAKQSFSLLFAVDAATTLAYGAVVWLRVPETRPAQAAVHEERRWHDLLLPFRDRLFVAVLFCFLLVGLCFSQVWTMLPLEMGRHGVPPQQYGFLMGINGFLIVALQLGSVKVVSRFSRPHVLAVSSVLVGAGFGLNALAGDWRGFAGSIVVWTLGEIIQMPVSSSLVADLAPAAHRGGYQGAFSLVHAASNTLGPLLGGGLLARFGSRWLWFGCFGLGLAASIGHLGLAGAQRRRLGSVA